MMGKQDLVKLIHNALAYPYAWEKVGLGHVTVEQAAAYADDRARQLADAIWTELVTFEAERAETGEAGG